MARQYRDAFRLVESCVCDRLLTAQEQQIFDNLCVTDWELQRYFERG